MRRVLKRRWNMFNNKAIRQIINFTIVGVIAFFIDYEIMNICYSYLNFPLFIANSLGFAISLIFNYILSKKHVFKMEVNDAFLKFVTLSIIGLLINNVCVDICIQNVQLSSFSSKVIATVIGMVYNFISKKIVLEG